MCIMSPLSVLQQLGVRGYIFRGPMWPADIQAKTSFSLHYSLFTVWLGTWDTRFEWELRDNEYTRIVSQVGSF